VDTAAVLDLFPWCGHRRGLIWQHQGAGRHRRLGRRRLGAVRATVASWVTAAKASKDALFLFPNTDSRQG
jgi:hypothetical protein